MDHLGFAEVLVKQLHAVLDDLPIRAIKTGMFPDAAAIYAVSDVLRSRCKGIPLIVDPVLVASSGAALTNEDTVNALRQHLIPLATLLTPNLQEAGALAANKANGPTGIETAARSLLALGCGAVLLKGGHGEGDLITDLLLTSEERLAFQHPTAAGEYHGTGCMLSAAIAAAMAKGDSLEQAVGSAIDHVQAAIANARLPVRGTLHLISN